MESPPSTSTWSEAFILSDDSGLLLTSGSISSGSMSGESRSCCGQLPLEFQDSDCDDKSLSQADSLDGMSDIICGENFNTLKKGPHWNDLNFYKSSLHIDPPPEFQDKPTYRQLTVYEQFASRYADLLIRKAFIILGKQMRQIHSIPSIIHVPKPVYHILPRAFWTPEFFTFSPIHGGRPSSRSSLGSSRLSSSHNSLSVPTAYRADDSSFITQAVSHDTLSSNQISDLYNVPFDSDVYAIPVDTLRPPIRPRRNLHPRKRRRNTSSGCREFERHQVRQSMSRKVVRSDQVSLNIDGCVGKRHSVAGTSHTESEPIHMTLQEVRQYLQTLYSSSSDSSEQRDNIESQHTVMVTNNNRYPPKTNLSLTPKSNTNGNPNGISRCKKNILFNIKNKKVKDSCDSVSKQQIKLVSPNKQNKRKKTQTKTFSLKQTFCNIFRFRRIMSPEHVKNGQTDEEFVYASNCDVDGDVNNKNITNRALPPLPSSGDNETLEPLDFATSIRKVKDYGWYWGPLSGEAAEKILSNEPDGSFIVRDSSDDHYIFSLTLKLNNSVRHVRIEHDQGNFSFGSCTKFKSQTIVEFIENAVEHSRSGRYLFFLHRRPTIGPVRVQLLHPVSRFKQIQSLQHMCRFVINKYVRKDLIQTLPLPRRMIDYLSTPHYYSELVDAEEYQESSKVASVVSSGNSTNEINAQENNLAHEVHNNSDHEHYRSTNEIVTNYVLVRNRTPNNNNINNTNGDTRQS